jgi:hypothetical protein
MTRLFRPAGAAFAAALALTILADPAQAQVRGFIRLFRPYHQVVLVQLPEVEKALALKQEQKDKALDLYDELNEERGALFQEAAGDFDSIREDMQKLNDDIAKKFEEALDETQKKRLAELYVQANGAVALFDANVSAALKISDEQKEKLAAARSEAGNSWRDVDWQGLSEEDAEKEIDKLIAEQNEAYAAVLTDEQKAAFEKMKGEELKIDLANLPNPFGG